LATRWLRGRIDGALQLGYQFRNGAVQLVSEVANASPVARIPRMNSDRLKQHCGWDVVGMSNKRDRHPSVDRLICRAHLPRPPAGPGGEDESACDRQHEGEPNSQCALPRFPHNSNIAKAGEKRRNFGRF